MKKIKFSVVIPMYNSSKFILTCLPSVTGYSDIEVIIVDDGSTDSSVSIVQNYIETHNGNFYLYQMPHRGLSLTRRTGVEKAHSDYIAFLDSDDVMNIPLYCKLLDDMKKNNVSVGIGRVRSGFSILPFPSINRKRGNRVINLEQEKSALCSLVTLFTCKIWKKDILSLWNSSCKANEDIESVPFLLACAKKVFYTNDVIYQRVLRSDSLASLYVCDTSSSRAIRNTVYPLLSLKKKFEDAQLYDFYKNEVDAIMMKHFFERLFNIQSNQKIKNKKDMSVIVMRLLNLMVPDFLNNFYYQEKFSKMEINDRFCYLISHKKLYSITEDEMSVDDLLEEYDRMIQLRKKKKKKKVRI